MVAIKGLKMPKCCKECPLFHFYFDIEGVMHFICKYGNVEILEYDKKRNDTCTLQFISKPKIGQCKDCKHWKDSDGAESQCPINSKKVFEGNGYCYMFEPKENEVIK